MITVNVSRFNKETDSEPYFESYEIEKTQGMKLLDAQMHFKLLMKNMMQILALEVLVEQDNVVHVVLNITAMEC